MRHGGRERRAQMRRTGPLCAAAAVSAAALTAGCGNPGPLTVSTGRTSHLAPASSAGGTAGVSSPVPSSPATGPPATGAGPGSSGPLVARAKALIATPPGRHLVSCFGGTLPQFIASGRDPRAATDRATWRRLKANGITTTWNQYFGATRSNCQAAIDGRMSSVAVGEVVYTFQTTTEPRDAFDSNLFSTATAPPTPRPGLTVGPRTGFGGYSESAAEANGSHTLVWVAGNVLAAVVAPTTTAARKISQQIRAKF